MKDLTLLILAAGLGSRFGGIKQLEQVGPNGERLIDYSILHAVQAGFNKIALIIRPELQEDFQKLSETWKEKYNVSVSFAFQELSNIPKGFTVPQDRKKMWVTN